MLIVLTVAAGAALAVVVYNAVRDRDPDLADEGLRRVRQLAGVITALVAAVERSIESLAGGRSYSRPAYASRDRYWLDDE